MARGTSSGPGADEPYPVSGAGGVPLVAVAVRSKGVRAASDPLLAELAALGFFDAEQVVAATAVPGVREHLLSIPGVAAAELDSLVERARSGLPTAREVLVAQPAPRDLGMGVPLPSDDMVAAAVASAESPSVTRAVLPAAVNLIPLMPPIRNQAARGTCVSFTLTALNEYVLRRRGFVRDLSEQHLYFEVKQVDGNPTGCGTHQSKAVVVLSTRGQCPEAMWPYDPNNPCNNHGFMPARARQEGLSHRLATHAVSVRDVGAYKAEMAAQRPVTLSIPVYDSWYQSAETRRSGRITMRIGSEVAHGGHAVLLVGYQDSPDAPGGGYFLVRNSWSTTNWGYQCVYGAGYGTIPYQYIANDAYEAYSAQVPLVRAAAEADARDVVDTEPKSTVTIKVGSNVVITVESD